MEEKLFIKNKRGLNLAAIINRPEEVAGKSYPVILMFHGFTGYKEEETYVDLAKQFSADGYVTVRFDASGYGESEGTLAEDYRFSNYLDDASLMLEYALNLDYVSKEHVFLLGQSMGGMITTYVAAQNPGKIEGVVIIEAPDTMLSSHFGRELPEIRVRGYVERVSSKYGTIRIPAAFFDDVAAFDAAKEIVKVDAPKLFIVGEKDMNVRPEISRNIFDNASEPKQWVSFDDVDHYYKKEPEKLAKVNAVITKFIKDLHSSHASNS